MEKAYQFALKVFTSFIIQSFPVIVVLSCDRLSDQFRTGRRILPVTVALLPERTVKVTLKIAIWILSGLI